MSCSCHKRGHFTPSKILSQNLRQQAWAQVGVLGVMVTSEPSLRSARAKASGHVSSLSGIHFAALLDIAHSFM